MSFSHQCCKIPKFQATLRFLRYFKASISARLEKALLAKPNWTLISNGGSSKFKTLRPKGSNFVYKCNVEIMNMGNRGKVSQARKLFDEMPQRDIVSYNSMITVYLKNKDLPRAEIIFKTMPKRSIIAESAMIDGYVKAGRLYDARKVFDSMRERNAFSWTSLISGYFGSGQIEEGQRLFDQMPTKNVVSWTILILGYARNGFMDQARKCFNLMPEKNTIAWTAMMKAYVENDCFHEAYKLFQEMPLRNLHSWNIMIFGCLKCNKINEAIHLFNTMPNRSPVTWTTIVSGLARNKMIEKARKYFDRMPNKDIAAWNAMITAYVDEGLMIEADELFILMPDKNVVTWNIMLDGYTRNGNEGKALQHFVLMQRSCFRPNENTLTSLITSCGSMLELMQVHAQVIHLGFKNDTTLTNALITAYSRSGDICSAWLAFEQLKSKDAISWTAMIIAYSIHGYGCQALEVFAGMLRSGTKPEEITFVGLLSACSHTGLVNKGRRIFEAMMQAYNLNPKAVHYSCLVDILGRGGLVDDAVNVVCKMPPSERDGAVLGTLLSACKLHGDVTKANPIGEKLLELEPSSSGGYILLANAYAAEGRWNEYAQLRKKMRERNVKKVPGYSQIEVQGKNHVFLVRDRSHPQVEEIYGLLQQNLEPMMREMGCKPGNPLLVE